METRSQKLRRRQRQVLLWSMAVAAALHVSLFALAPEFSRSLSDSTSSPLGEGGEIMPESIWINVIFGPPTVRLPNGEERREPAARFLEARDVAVRDIPIHPDCDWLRAEGFERVTGVVRLVVGGDGRVGQAALEESFGNHCIDQGLVAVSARLWYHWLPNEDVAAPVHVIQPMTVEPAI